MLGAGGLRGGGVRVDTRICVKRLPAFSNARFFVQFSSVRWQMLGPSLFSNRGE